VSGPEGSSTQGEHGECRRLPGLHDGLGFSRACISHRLSTAADNASYPAVFSHLGVLSSPSWRNLVRYAG